MDNCAVCRFFAMMISRINKSSRSCFLLPILVLTIFLSRYVIPVDLPGPLSRPIKYKIVSGILASIVDLTFLWESFTGLNGFRLLNDLVDTYDRFRVRSNDQIQYEDRFIDDILVRIYTPKNLSNNTLSPVIFSIHGGGLFFGSIYSYDTMNRFLTLKTGFKMRSNDFSYRLSPDVNYPQPIEDCVKTIRTVINNHQEYLIDPHQVFLIGDSAGAQLTVVIERRLRQQTIKSMRGVVLVYPFLQWVDFRLPSYRTYLPYRLLSLLQQDTIARMINFYLNTSFTGDQLMNNHHLSIDDYDLFHSKLNGSILDDNSFISHPDTAKLFDIDVSPLLANHSILIDSPTTLIVACQYDIFLSDAQIFYERLKKHSNNEVFYKEFQTFHGALSFIEFPITFPDSFEILDFTAEFFSENNLTYLALSVFELTSYFSVTLH